MEVVSPWENALNADTGQDVSAQTDFAGRRGRLFWLAFRTGLLTVLTLGFYRFWMKTRLRRWYWSAWRPAGHSLEYAGDPWEKLLGFLIAVVILAFYVGIVNLLLMFASFSLFNGNVAAYVLSFLGVIPLWFYARYRARRYVLARTRWRGVRFGLEPGAWGYAKQAMWHWFLTLITLGFLWPRKAFYLEKYITDRTYFGAQSLAQNGTWTGLLRPWLWLWISVVALAGSIGLLIFYSTELLSSGSFLGGRFEFKVSGSLSYAVWTALVSPLAILVTLVNYNVKRLKYLTSHKVAGPVELAMAPRFWKVLGIYVWGYGLASVVAALTIVPMFVVGAVMIERSLTGFGAGLGALEALPQYVLSGIALGSYFLLFLMWSVLMHAFIRFPLMRHFASTLTISNIADLARVPQRPRDEFTEAEGFAEALDVGAAI